MSNPFVKRNATRDSFSPTREHARTREAYGPARRERDRTIDELDLLDRYNNYESGVLENIRSRRARLNDLINNDNSSSSSSSGSNDDSESVDSTSAYDNEVYDEEVASNKSGENKNSNDNVVVPFKLSDEIEKEDKYDNLSRFILNPKQVNLFKEKNLFPSKHHLKSPEMLNMSLDEIIQSVQERKDKDGNKYRLNNNLKASMDGAMRARLALESDKSVLANIEVVEQLYEALKSDPSKIKDAYEYAESIGIQKENLDKAFVNMQALEVNEDNAKNAILELSDNDDEFKGLVNLSREYLASSVALKAFDDNIIKEDRPDISKEADKEKRNVLIDEAKSIRESVFSNPNFDPEHLPAGDFQDYTVSRLGEKLQGSSGVPSANPNFLAKKNYSYKDEEGNIIPVPHENYYVAYTKLNKQKKDAYKRSKEAIDKLNSKYGIDYSMMDVENGGLTSNTSTGKTYDLLKLGSVKERAVAEEERINKRRYDIVAAKTGRTGDQLNFAERAIVRNMPIGGYDDKTDAEMDALYAASDQVEDMITTADNKQFDMQNNRALGFARGVVMPFTRAKSYDLLSVGDISTNKYLYDISKKNPGDWTIEELNAISLLNDKQSLDSFVSSLGGHNASKYGAAFSEMIPFMVPMVGTSKLGSLATKGGSALLASKTAGALAKGTGYTLKYGGKIMNMSAADDVAKYAYRHLGTANKAARMRLANSLAGGVRAANATALGALQANTIGYGRMRADAYGKMTGYAVYNPEMGTYIFEDAMKEDEAMQEARIDNTIEYISEAFGVSLSRSAKTLIRDIPVVGEFFKSLSRVDNSVFGGVKKMTDGVIGGLPEEMSEEVFGNMLRASFGIMDWSNKDGTGALDTEQNIETFLHLLSGMGVQSSVQLGLSSTAKGASRWNKMRTAEKSARDNFILSYASNFIDSNGKKLDGYKEKKKEAESIIRNISEQATAGNYREVAESIASMEGLSNSQKASLVAAVGMKVIRGSSNTEISDEIIKNGLEAGSIETNLANNNISIIPTDEDGSGRLVRASSGNDTDLNIEMNTKTGEFKTKDDEIRFKALNLKSSASNRDVSGAIHRESSNNLFNKAMHYQMLSESGRLDGVMKSLKRADKKNKYSGKVDAKRFNNDMYSEMEFARDVKLLNKQKEIFTDEFKSLGIKTEDDKRRYVAAFASSMARKNDRDLLKNSLISSVKKGLSSVSDADDVDSFRDTAEEILKLNNTKDVGLSDINLDDETTKNKITDLLISLAIADRLANFAAAEPSGDKILDTLDNFKLLYSAAMSRSYDADNSNEARLAKMIYESNKGILTDDFVDALLSSVADERMYSGQTELKTEDLLKEGIFTDRNLSGLSNKFYANNKSGIASIDNILNESGVTALEDELKSLENIRESVIIESGSPEEYAERLEKAILRASETIGGLPVADVLKENEKLLKSILASIVDIDNKYIVRSNSSGGYLYKDKTKMSDKEKEDLLSRLRSMDSSTKDNKALSKEREEDDVITDETPVVNNIVPSSDMIRDNVLSGLVSDPDNIKVSNVEEFDDYVIADVNAKLDIGIGIKMRVKFPKTTTGGNTSISYDYFVQNLSTDSIDKESADSISKSLASIISRKVKDALTTDIIDYNLIKVAPESLKKTGAENNPTLSFNVSYNDKIVSDDSFIEFGVVEGKLIYRLDIHYLEISNIILDEVESLDNNNPAGASTNDSDEPGNKGGSSQPAIDEKDEKDEIPPDLNSGETPDSTPSVEPPAGTRESKLDSYITQRLNGVAQYNEAQAEDVSTMSDIQILIEDTIDGIVSDINDNAADRHLLGELDPMRTIASRVSRHIFGLMPSAQLENVLARMDASKTLTVMLAASIGKTGNSSHENLHNIAVSTISFQEFDPEGYTMSKKESGSIATTIYDIDKDNPTARKFISENYDSYADITYEYVFEVLDPDSGKYTPLTVDAAKAIIAKIAGINDSLAAKQAAIIEDGLRIIIYGNLPNGKRELVGRFADLGDIPSYNKNAHPVDIDKAIVNQWHLLSHVATNGVDGARYFAEYKNPSAGNVINMGEHKPISENKILNDATKTDADLRSNMMFVNKFEKNGFEFITIDKEVDHVWKGTDRNAAPLVIRTVDRFGVKRYIDAHGKRFDSESEEGRSRLREFIEFLFLNAENLNKDEFITNDSDGNAHSFRLSNSRDKSLAFLLNRVIALKPYDKEKIDKGEQGLYFGVPKDGKMFLQFVKGGAPTADSKPIIISFNDVKSNTERFDSFITAIGSFHLNMWKYNILDKNGSVLTDETGNHSGLYIPGLVDFRGKEFANKSIMRCMMESGLVTSNFDGFNEPFQYCKGIKTDDSSSAAYNDKAAKTAKKSTSTTTKSSIASPKSEEEAFEALSNNSNAIPRGNKRYISASAVARFSSTVKTDGIGIPDGRYYGTIIDTLLRNLVENPDYRPEDIYLDNVDIFSSKTASLAEAADAFGVNSDEKNTVLAVNAIGGINALSNVMTSLRSAISALNEELKDTGAVLHAISKYSQKDSSYSGIQLFNSEWGIRGEADIVAIYPDGSISIYDLKTHLNDTSIDSLVQDNGAYGIQLNLYASMASVTNGVRVRGLGVIDVGLTGGGVMGLDSSTFNGIKKVKIRKVFSVSKNKGIGTQTQTLISGVRIWNSNSKPAKTVSEKPIETSETIEQDIDMSLYDPVLKKQKKIMESRRPGESEEFLRPYSNRKYVDEELRIGGSSMSIKDVLAYIKDNSIENYRFLKALEPMLRAIGVDSIDIVDGGISGSGVTILRKHESGVTSVQIQVDLSAAKSRNNLAETIVHELTHASLLIPIDIAEGRIPGSKDVVDAFNEARALYNDVVSVLSQAPSLLGSNRLNTLKSLDEFLAESTSSDEFDTIDKLYDKSILNRLYNAFRGLFNALMRVFGITYQMNSRLQNKVRKIALSMVTASLRDNQLGIDSMSRRYKGLNSDIGDVVSEKYLYRPNTDGIDEINETFGFESAAASTVMSSVASFGIRHVHSLNNMVSDIDFSSDIENVDDVNSRNDIIENLFSLIINSGGVSSDTYALSRKLFPELSDNIDIFCGFMRGEENHSDSDIANVFKSTKELIDAVDTLNYDTDRLDMLARLSSNNSLRGITTNDFMTQSINVLFDEFSDKINGDSYRFINSEVELHEVARSVALWYISNNVDELEFSQKGGVSIPVSGILEAINNKRNALLDRINDSESTVLDDEYAQFDMLTDILMNMSSKASNKSFVKAINAELIKLGVNMNYSKALNFLSLSRDNSNDENSFEYGKEHGQVSLMKSMSKKAKFILATIPKTSHGIPVINKKTGLPEFYDIITAFREITSMFHMVSHNEQIFHIKDAILKSNDPSINKQLAADFCLKFGSLSAPSRSVLTNALNTARRFSSNTVYRRGKFTVVDSNKGNAILYERNRASKVLDTIFGFSDDLKAGSDKFSEFKKGSAKKLFEILDELDDRGMYNIDDKFRQESSIAISSIFKKLGFSITASEVQDYIFSNPSTIINNSRAYEKLFLDITSHIEATLSNATEELESIEAEGLELQTESSYDLSSIYSTYNKNSIHKNKINSSYDFIDTYIIKRKAANEDFAINGNGERVSLVGPSTACDSLLNKLFNPEESSDNNDIKDSFGNSIMLTDNTSKSISSIWGLVSEDGASDSDYSFMTGIPKVKMVRDNVSTGMDNKAKSNPTDFKNRSQQDDYIARALRLLNGNIIFPTMSDSGTSYALEIEGRDVVKEHLNSNGFLTNRGYTAMAELFLAEVQMARNAFVVWRNNKDSKDPNVLNNLVTNYHLDNKRKNFGRGLLLKRFGLMYDSGGNVLKGATKNTTSNGDVIDRGNINDRLERALTLGDYDEYDRLTKFLEDSLRGFISNSLELSGELFNEIKNSFDGKLKQISNIEREKMESLGISDEDRMPEEFYTNEEDDDSSIYSEDIIASRRIAYLNFLSINEFEKFLCINMAMFKDKDGTDMSKRLKVWMSHGTEPAISNTDTIDLVSEATDNLNKIKIALNEAVESGDSGKISALEHGLEVANETLRIANRLEKEYNDSMKRRQFTFAAMSTIVSKADYGENNSPTRQAMMDSIKESYTKIAEDRYANHKGKDKQDVVDKAVSAMMSSLTGIKSTDGAAFVTIEMYRAYLIKEGRLIPDLSRRMMLIDKIDKGLALSPAEQALIMQPLKLIYTGCEGYNYSDNGEVLANTLKMAVFPLIPSLCREGTVGGDMLKAMKDNGVDMMGDAEVEKFGQRHVHELFEYNQDGTSINLKENASGSPIAVRQLKFQFLRRQLETDVHEDETRSLGTQGIVMPLSNIFNRNITLSDGRTLKGEEVAKMVFDKLTALSDYGCQEFLSMYGKYDENTNEWYMSNERLAQLVKANAADKNLGADVANLAKIDKNGQMQFPLWALMSDELFAQTIISKFNDLATEITTAGGSFVQSPGVLLNTTNTTQSQFEMSTGKLVNRGRRLEFLNEHGCMDTVISINAFRGILKKALGDNYKFNEAKKWLIDQNIIGPNAKPTGLGYRIPTQSISSMPVLRVVDIVDSVHGDLVMLPDEYIAITGSDFDIDKLYFAMRHYEYDKDADSVISMEEYKNRLPLDTPDSEMLDVNKRLISSELVDMYMDIITSKEMQGLSYTSIDQSKFVFKETEMGIGLIKDTLGEVSGIKANSEYINSLAYQVDKRAENMGSKEGIGPFALMATNHIYAQIAGLKLSKKGRDILGVSNLGGYVARDGQLITSWASYMVDAHVDAAKDPYILSLNVNKFTWNATSLLLRAGFGAHTMYFVCQPGIKKLAEIKEDSESSLSPDNVKSKTARFEDAKYEYVVGLLEKLEDNDSDLDVVDLAKKMFKIDDKKKRVTIDGNELSNSEFALIRDMFLSNDAVELTEEEKRDGVFRNKGVRNLKWNLDASRSSEDKESPRFIAEQILVMGLFDSVTNVGKELADLTSVCQVDTKKFGNTRGQLEAHDARVVSVMFPEDKSSSYIENPLDMFTKTHIGAKYSNTYKTLDLFFKNASVSGTKGFIDIYRRIREVIGKDKYIEDTNVSFITQAIQDAAIGPFFVKLADELGTSAEELLRSKDMNIATIFEKLKGEIEREAIEYQNGKVENPKYKDLYETGLDIIKALSELSGVSTNVHKGNLVYSVMISSVTDSGSSIESDIKRALIALYNNEHSKDIIEKLFISSYYSGGFISSRNSLFKLMNTSVGPLVTLGDGRSYSEALKGVTNGLSTVSDEASHIAESVVNTHSSSVNMSDRMLENDNPSVFQLKSRIDIRKSKSAGEDVETIYTNKSRPFVILSSEGRSLYKTMVASGGTRGEVITYKRIGVKRDKKPNSKTSSVKYIYVQVPRVSMTNNGFVFKTDGTFSLDSSDRYFNDFYSSDSYQNMVNAVIREYANRCVDALEGKNLNYQSKSIGSVYDAIAETGMIKALIDIFNGSEKFEHTYSEIPETFYDKMMSSSVENKDLSFINTIISRFKSDPYNTSYISDLVDYIDTLNNNATMSQEYKYVSNAIDIMTYISSSLPTHDEFSRDIPTAPIISNTIANNIKALNNRFESLSTKAIGRSVSPSISKAASSDLKGTTITNAKEMIESLVKNTISGKSNDTPSESDYSDVIFGILNANNPELIKDSTPSLIKSLSEQNMVFESDNSKAIMSAIDLLFDTSKVSKDVMDKIKDAANECL